MKKFAVVGNEISYTLSPLFHSIIYKQLGIEASYGVEDIAVEHFDTEITRIMAEYDGFNVTKPFKKDILRYVTSDCAAVNTVTAKDKCGYNTDGTGFLADLIDFVGDVSGRNVLVLGVGGAGEIIARVITAAGGNVSLYNRTYDKAERLAKQIGGSLEMNDIEIVINCMTYDVECGWDIFFKQNSLNDIKYAYDLRYYAERTLFTDSASKQGARVRNGLGMLVNQAIKADELFFGITISEQDSLQIREKIKEQI